jgi:hypothetical protein
MGIVISYTPFGLKKLFNLKWKKVHIKKKI